MLQIQSDNNLKLKSICNKEHHFFHTQNKFQLLRFNMHSALKTEGYFTIGI